MGAGIAVTTADGSKLASLRLRTRILGADRFVIAGDRFEYAPEILHAEILGAHQSVITQDIRENAPNRRIAPRNSADVTIIARRGRVLAFAVHIAFVGGAGIVIVTSVCCGDATQVGLACV